MTEMYVSSALPNGAGAAFEQDGDTGYFYLFDMGKPDESKIVGHIGIANAPPGFHQEDLEILWSADERYVGLAVKGVLRAAFDMTTHETFGGSEIGFEIPEAVLKAF